MPVDQFMLIVVFSVDKLRKRLGKYFFFFIALFQNTTIFQVLTKILFMSPFFNLNQAILGAGLGFSQRSISNLSVSPIYSSFVFF